MLVHFHIYLINPGARICEGFEAWLMLIAIHVYGFASILIHI
jgi:hypothetical protein